MNEDRVGLRAKLGSIINCRFLLLLISLSALGIRLYDLTDPPLDFHSTRQLGSAIVARGMYFQNRDDIPDWQRETAISMWQGREVYEPRILEWIVAQTYTLLGEEQLWIVRIYTSLAWVLGGLGLYHLVKRIVDQNAALGSVIVFQFLPFGVLASRSFQPDPIMVSLLIFALLAFHIWRENPTWKNALSAGTIAGAAILVKPVAFFPLIPCLAGLVLTKMTIREVVRRPQIWLIPIIAIVPTIIYSVFLIPQSSGGFLQYWTSPFLHLLISVDFYVGWVQTIQSTIGFDLFILALIGSLLVQDRGGRGIVVGMWLGYGLYALIFPYQIMTHDYYHLMLIPFTAICLAPLFAFIIQKTSRLIVFYRIIVVMVIVSWIIVRMWQVKVDLDQRDYRNETERWSELREQIPRDGEIIALTQAYGYRMNYYAWIEAANWPVTADIFLENIKDSGVFDYEAEFARRTKGFDYFLVTNFGEFEEQQQLREILTEGYPIYRHGKNFVLYDLRGGSN